MKVPWMHKKKKKKKKKKKSNKNTQTHSTDFQCDSLLE